MALENDDGTALQIYKLCHLDKRTFRRRVTNYIKQNLQKKCFDKPSKIFPLSLTNTEHNRTDNDGARACPNASGSKGASQRPQPQVLPW
jgi:hypothetical protein